MPPPSSSPPLPPTPAPHRPRPSRRGRFGGSSLARQLLVLQVLVVAVLVAVGVLLAYLDARRAGTDGARDKVFAVATAVADAPDVTAALTRATPSTTLQPYAERVRVDTRVDFITIMTPDGIRYTHPNPALIGQRFLGSIADARAGRPVRETYTGTLGPSERVVLPVFGTGGRVVALVAVGITVEAISAELRERLPPVLAVAGAALVAGAAGSLLVSRRLARQTRGVAPAELRNLFDYHEAVLHAVREGLVLVDAAGRVALCNDAARELLALPRNPVGTDVSALGLADELTAALTAAEPRTDEIHVTEDRVLLVSTEPVRSGQRAMGTVVTLRDHTELQSLTGELNTVRGFAESLRSQAHESANRLHTVVSLVELGRPEQAVEFATAELRIAQRLTDRVVAAVAEPVLAALLLGKAAEAGERGVELVIGADTAVDSADLDLDPHDLVTVLGNLVDNAFDAALDAALDSAVDSGSGERPRVTVTVRRDGDALLLRVGDNGRGVPADAVPELFRRGWSSKPVRGPGGRGLGLALVGQVVRRHGGAITVHSGVGDSTVDGAESGERPRGAVFTVRLPDGGVR